MALPKGINSTQELLEAQSYICNHTLTFIKSMSLKCAIDLGIPDIIANHAGPITISELSDALGFNTSRSACIERLVRMLVSSRLLTMVKNAGHSGREGYCLTPASRLLVSHEPLSMAPFVRVMLSPTLTDPWNRFSQWFADGDTTTPLAMAHGGTLWDVAAREPGVNQSFNEGMASDARLATSVIVGYCGQIFQGLSSLVDVGGGTGTMGKAIVDAFPGLKCTVLDLPHVVEGLEGSENLSFVGGDMFESIPHADAVLMKCIMHDWTDKDCVEILKRCKEAIPSRENGGKVIIVDIVLEDEVENKKWNEAMEMETRILWDMEMMALVGGKERTEKEWAKLFYDAGFSSYKINACAVGLRSLIVVYP